MSTTWFIRSYIMRLPAGRMFTTRELLGFGTRVAVDQALFRMVKKGMIRRLARGVFLLNDQVTPDPPVEDVARVKARAFGKRIACHGADAANKRGLPVETNQIPTYATNGRSSSFRYGELTVHLKGIGPRKMLAGDNPAGLTVKGLWHLGKTACNGAAFAAATLDFNRRDRQELRRLAVLVPAWMSRHFVVPRWDPQAAAVLFAQ